MNQKTLLHLHRVLSTIIYQRKKEKKLGVEEDDDIKHEFNKGNKPEMDL